MPRAARNLSLLPGALLLLSLAPIEAPAQRTPVAGVVQGIVRIQAAAPMPVPRPGIGDLGAPSSYEPQEARRAVVYLEDAPVAAFGEPGGRHRATMNQVNETFVPHVLAVSVGTIVDFPNSDPIFHNVFSLSKTKRFDLGRYERGRSKAVLFDRPGIVRVFCDIHSHMSAFILVFAHPFYAVTDRDGRYRIEGVPPGTYSVAAWYEGDVRETAKAIVPDGGGTARADFNVSR